MDKARGDERACDKKRAGEEHHARLNSLLFPLSLRSVFSKEATGTAALSLVPKVHAVPDYKRHEIVQHIQYGTKVKAQNFDVDVVVSNDDYVHA